MSLMNLFFIIEYTYLLAHLLSMKSEIGGKQRQDVRKPSLSAYECTFSLRGTVKKIFTQMCDAAEPLAELDSHQDSI